MATLDEIRELLDRAGEALSDGFSDVAAGIESRALNQFRADLKAQPPEERYEFLKSKISTIPGIDAGPLISKLDDAGPDIQQALIHAIANNETFLKYVVDKARLGGESGNENFLDETLDNLFVRNEEGEILRDPNTNEALLKPETAGPLADILNTIGNNPNKDFGEGLDELSSAAKAYKIAKEANDAALEQKALHRLVDATRALGGQLPFYAKFDIQNLLEMIQSIINGTPPQQAWDKFTDTLGLEGKQLEMFQENFSYMPTALAFQLEPLKTLNMQHPGVINSTIEHGQEIMTGLGGNDRVVAVEETELEGGASAAELDGGQSNDDLSISDEHGGNNFGVPSDGAQSPRMIGKTEFSPAADAAMREASRIAEARTPEHKNVPAPA